MKSLYESDFHAWCYQQAKLLADHKEALPDLDLQNLIEEIESMGGSERRELVNRIAQLFLHLLKWKYQPERRGSRWESSIKDQRKRVERILGKNPSLKSFLYESIEEGYEDGRRMAWEETDLEPKVFPETNPFPYPELLSEGWFPE